MKLQQLSPWCMSPKGWMTESERANIKNKNGEPFPSYVFDNDTKAWYLNQGRMTELGSNPTPTSEQPSTHLYLPSYLMPYQKEALKKLAQQRVLLAHWPTGAGKSLLALAYATTVNHTLIITPRMTVEKSWPQQCNLWTPELSSFFQTSSRKWPEVQPSIIVISMDSLHRLPWNNFDFIVIDELHNIIHNGTQRQRKIKELLLKNPHAARLGLTATPFGTAAWDIQSQLDTLMPNAWGYPGIWKDYFHEWDESGYEGRRKHFGLKPARVQEFVDYIKPVMSVVSREELKGHLPLVTWDIQYHDGPEESHQVESNWMVEAKRTQSYRVSPLIKSIPRFQDTAILTYFQSTADEIGKVWDIPVINGTIAPKKRAKMLDNVSVFVGTMRSINEGLDLRKFTNVHVVEAYPVPRYLTQVIGRFIRLGATAPVTITLYAIKNSMDEILYPRLVERMTAQQEAFGAGTSTETALLGLLQQKKNDTAFLEGLHLKLGQILDFDDSLAQDEEEDDNF